MKLLTVLKPFVPPFLTELAQRLLQGRGIQYSGDYPTWQAALHVAGSYDAPAILERIRLASSKVKQGDAVFERDSVCFNYEDYRWPTIACLLRAVAENGGRLRALDFGGSLGCFYFQHRKFFSGLKEIRWAIVEQAHFVACGRDEFQSDELYFYNSIRECLSGGPVDVVLCSSSLQYIEHPYEVLDDLADIKADYIILDRTGFVQLNRDVLTVQHADFGGYKQSLPAWFFSKTAVINRLSNHGYVLEMEFPCLESAEIKGGEFAGMAFKLRGKRK